MTSDVTPTVGELRTRDSARFERAISTVIAPLKFVSSTDLFFGKFRWVEQDLTHVGRATNGQVRANSLGARQGPTRFVFCFQVTGHGAIEQHGRRTEIGRDQVSLYRSDSPYELTFTSAGERVGIAITSYALGISPGRLDRLAATRLDLESPLVSTVSKSIVDYERALHIVPAQNRRHVLDLIVSALRTTVASLPDDERPHLREELFRQASAYIDAMIGDPELSPQRIAQALFVSTRTLQHSFAASGTGVAQLIRERRLRLAVSDLRNPSQSHIPISEIARRWGFTSASHFAELVRQSFGSSPSALRAGRTLS